ncbi:MAG: polysaccharide deacetylase family protein [Treponema sp.]|jgi:peptidoglycan/xylan/chitin deacetylase (PgdA/CDA1 family)|nr:polysaccharide deacetylase family protein [Treponema sp.]
MKKILVFFYIVTLFSSCMSINRSREELNVPLSYVIFSFDDGPNIHEETTNRLLDILELYEIKAIFSLLGERVDANPQIVKRMYDEGHCIVNHGYSDKWARGMREAEFRENLLRGGQAISNAIGREFDPKLYRPHGGYYNSKQINICNEEGYLIINSNIRVYDAVLPGTKKDKVVKSVIVKVEKQGGGIVLLHDARDSNSRMEEELTKAPNGAFNRSWIPETTEKLIILLKERGYMIGSPDIVIQNNP